MSARALVPRRRQIQLQSTGGDGAWQMARAILTRDGVPGFYRGFLPNALKNLPNKGRLPCLLSDHTNGLRPCFLQERVFSDPSSVCPGAWGLVACGSGTQRSTNALACAGVRLAIFDGAKKLVKRAEEAYSEEVAVSQGRALVKLR